MNLRPYQAEVIESLWRWFETHPEGNPLLVLPTGSGKSVIVAEISRQAITRWPGSRILMTVRSRELVDQNYEKLMKIWPKAPAGVHSASAGRKDLGADILFSTIGSVYKKAHLLGKVDLIIIDEAHLCETKESGMYRQLVSELRRYVPHVRVVGLTATPFRGPGYWLTDGEAPLFTHIAETVTINTLLTGGYLAPLVSAKTPQIFDASEVGMRGGDFVVSELAKALDKSELISAACANLCAIGADRQHWIVFGVTVAHCEHIRDELRKRGISAEVVSADTEKNERQRHIQGFRNGRIRALVSVNALSIGFDAPATDLIALMRNTRSPGFYVQVAGRGMRTAPSKVDCLWADYTDTTAVMGPVDAIRGRARPKPREAGAGGFKVCDQCGNACAPGARACECGFQFPEPELIKHTTQASSAAVMSTEAEPATTEYRVSRVTYSVHQKPGKPDTLQVDYWTGYRRIASEWVCFDHQGWPRQKAEAWWSQRAPESSTGWWPKSSREAVEVANAYPVRRPTHIRVNEQGRFPEIVGYQFGEQS